MNLFSRFVPLMTLACVFSAWHILMPGAAAQTLPPREEPQASPTRSNTDPSSTTSSPPTSATMRLSTPREQREQAYAKLLEGQRYLTNARPGATASPALMKQQIQLAEHSFQQAAALDPTLAEAHTALSEIAFFYPPQNFEQAAREATIATSIDPDNFGAHRLLSRVYAIKSGLHDNNLNKTFVDRAVAELREVTRLYPSDAESWALLGELYQATGRTAEAITAFTHWAAAPPATDPRVFQFVTNGHDLSPASAAARLGEVLLGAGRTTEAIPAIRRAISLDPDNKEYAELLSRAFAAGGDDPNAIATLQRIVTADPNNIASVNLLAQAQAHAGRFDDAAATLRAAIARRTKDDRDQLTLRLHLAQILSEALRYPDAIAVYEDLLKDRGIGNAKLTSAEQKDFAAKILPSIVSLQKSAGQISEATATIERMRLLLGQDDPTADDEYIGLLRDQGKRREALQAVQAARLRYPQHSEFAQLEAETLADLGRVDEGVSLLRTRLKGSLADFGLYLLISNLYAQAGRGAEAVKAAKTALELVPPERQDLIGVALITLSSAQERAGDPKGSEESLRNVLAKEPDNATALNNLGYFLLERNERLNEALELIRRAVKAEPTNSSFLDSLGWAYFKLGQLDEAERQLSEAARRNASSATIQDHLGDLYRRRGKLDLARAAWQKALALSVEAGETARIRSKLSGETK